MRELECENEWECGSYLVREEEIVGLDRSELGPRNAFGRIRGYQTV